MHRTYVTLLAAALMVFIGAGLGGRSPAARVLELKGKATIVSGKNFERPAALYGTIYADERLVLDPDSQLALAFRTDGHIERVVKPGTYQVTKEGCTPTDGVEQVAMPERNRKVINKLSKGSHGIVQGGVVMVRAAAPPSSDNDAEEETETAFQPDWSKIMPRSGSTVPAVNPKFTWCAVPEAEKYVLKLYYLGDQVWATETQQTEATYEGKEALHCAGTYWWDVTATVDGKPVQVCESSFQTASEYQREQMASLKELLKNPDPISLAVAALWYRQNDLTDDAIAINEQLAKLAPSAGVYRELSELYCEIGRDQDGEAAAAKAEELEKE